jgi:archaellum biogenesis protein FlaJ (TadC family)
MKNDNFEMKLTEMTKPKIPHLKHEDMLGNAIINAKDKLVVSLWWLSVPAFIVLMLIMKSVYMPGTTFVSNLKEMEQQNKLVSILFYLISPIVLIIINAFSIRKIYFLSGSPKSAAFLQAAWLNIMVIALAAVVLMMYLL